MAITSKQELPASLATGHAGRKPVHGVRSCRRPDYFLAWSSSALRRWTAHCSTRSSVLASARSHDLGGGNDLLGLGHRPRRIEGEVLEAEEVADSAGLVNVVSFCAAR
jgi:hypothetical protein